MILKCMIDYSTKKRADPYSDMGAFHDFIKKSLKADVNKTQLQDKIRRLKKKYEMNVAKGKKYNPVKPHEQKVFDLLKKSKSNGKARTNQKGNNKTLASLKAKLLSSSEPPKECEKVEFGSDSLSEVIGYDKGFREMRLLEGVMKHGLELIGGARRAKLKEK
ncbi:unnamed protein product [Prunus armeniaca]|uniref:Glabrous enhancer-binding protein-like DBD domain-containing protein n=1 Tax=Prunus armeniaca TaxID=36596 RepID=A0A6J5X0R2_PRUAR|nr:unnamed protein product [Prunus armeniaca]